MGLEVPANDLISELNAAWPLEGDLLAAQNEHTQTIKRVLQNVFPNNTDVGRFENLFTFNQLNLLTDFEFDKATGTITRRGTTTRASRETAAAVTWTMSPFSTEDWQQGDVFEADIANGTDVTVVRAGTGLFTLPDGSQVTSFQQTEPGPIRMLYLGGPDNWRVLGEIVLTPFDADALILSASTFAGDGIASVNQSGLGAGGVRVIFDNAAAGINNQRISATCHTGNSTDGYSCNVFNENTDRCIIYTKLINVDPPVPTNRFPITVRRTLIP